MGQDARCIARTEVMLNLKLSANARILYYLIDDQSGTNGYSRWHWKKLAIRIGVGHSQFFSMVSELTVAGALLIERGNGEVHYIPAFRKTGKSHSGKPESAFRKTGMNAGRILIEPGIEPEPPLPPASGGIDVLSLEGAYEGCALCPLCGGEGEVVLRRSRSAECRQCGGRGFIDPSWQTVSIGAKAS